MAGLDIRPHSRRLSALAVAGLSVLAVGGFATGLGRQIAAASDPSPFPPAQDALPGIPAAVAIADGAPQAAAPALPARRAASAVAEPLAEAAAAPPAADASAVAVEPPPAPEPAAVEPQAPPAPPASDPPTL